MLSKPLRELTFTVVDTETTGLSPANDRLVEIAAIKVKPNLFIDIHDTFSELINPLCPISYRSYRVHGISNDMVQDKPTIDKVMPSFLDYVTDTVIVAHNAKFDISFINQALCETGLEPTFLHVIDTVKIAKLAFPAFGRYNLDSLIDLLNLYTEVDGLSRHRALFDAFHTAKLLTYCLESLEDSGIRHISDL